MKISKELMLKSVQLVMQGCEERDNSKDCPIKWGDWDYDLDINCPLRGETPMDWTPDIEEAEE